MPIPPKTIETDKINKTLITGANINQLVVANTSPPNKSKTTPVDKINERLRLRCCSFVNGSAFEGVFS